MEFKQEPYPHQLEIFDETKARESHAIFWEMGCGKTKTALDIAAWQYLEGHIDTLLVVAPRGVHRNWITDEVPEHLSPDVDKHLAIWYQGSRMGGKKYSKEMSDALAFDGFLIVAVNYDAVITKNGKAYCDQIMKQRKGVMMVLDESPRIKNPTAKRTKAVQKLGDRAVSRRILTGTPITNGPFDAYSQVLAQQALRDVRRVQEPLRHLQRPVSVGWQTVQRPRGLPERRLALRHPVSH